MSKPQAKVDGRALSMLTDVRHSALGSNTVRWCKRQIRRQERHAAKHFLAEVAKNQDLAFDDLEADFYDTGNQYETLAAHYERIAEEEAEQARPDEYDRSYYEPYDDCDRHGFEFDRWSDHDLQERDLWNVTDMAHSLARLDFNGKIHLVGDLIEVHGHDRDAYNAAKLLERLGFRVFRVAR